MNAYKPQGDAVPLSASWTGLLPAACLLAALLACGCSSWHLPDALAWKDRDDKPRVPDRVVDIWVDDVLHRSGEPSTRGFGGRIVFYRQDMEAPVKVDGSVTVYVFDDRCEDPMREPPIHKFVFPAATLAKHYSRSDVGHSYSFWLPIDEVGGPERKLTLITRFEPRLGGRLLSKPSTHMLPGIPGEGPGSPLVERYTKRLNGEIVSMGQAEPAAQAAEKTALPGVTSSTIPVPPAFARQMLAAPQPASPTQPAQGHPAPLAAAQGGAVIPAAGSLNPADRAAAVQPAGYLAPAPPAPPSPQAKPYAGSHASRFPGQRESFGRPIPSRVRRQPLPATWPSALPSTPRSAPPAGSPATASPPLAAPPAEWEE